MPNRLTITPPFLNVRCSDASYSEYLRAYDRFLDVASEIAGCGDKKDGSNTKGSSQHKLNPVIGSSDCKRSDGINPVIGSSDGKRSDGKSKSKLKGKKRGKRTSTRRNARANSPLPTDHVLEMSVTASDRPVTVVSELIRIEDVTSSDDDVISDPCNMLVLYEGNDTHKKLLPNTTRSSSNDRFSDRPPIVGSCPSISEEVPAMTSAISLVIEQATSSSNKNFDDSNFVIRKDRISKVLKPMSGSKSRSVTWFPHLEDTESNDKYRSPDERFLERCYSMVIGCIDHFCDAYTDTNLCLPLPDRGRSDYYSCYDYAMLFLNYDRYLHSEYHVFSGFFGNDLSDYTKRTVAGYFKSVVRERMTIPKEFFPSRNQPGP